MDKTKTNHTPPPVDQLAQTTRDALLDQAFDLACEAFGEPHDDVVTAIYERLVWNWQRGLGAAGAVTVH
ncbi:hypothetical protein ACMHYO_14195 [Allopusillimonas ginsengisoli]|uniref:hypothetical protein n=1 Tax=Allopusillimonas ginsengisoli TaxID=453575 RepID=UPI0039C324C0